MIGLGVERAYVAMPDTDQFIKEVQQPMGGQWCAKTVFVDCRTTLRR